MFEFCVPYLSPEKIENCALRFLKEHHAGLSIPVPVELIVEKHLGIEIFPMRGMLKAFDIFSCISHDLSTIYVDELVFERDIHRYRFSLAHELGHLCLHRETINNMCFKTIEEWHEMRESLSAREYGYLETQANKFAGMLLMPLEPLKESFDRFISIISEKMEIDQPGPELIRFVASEISKEYQVSQQSADIRINSAGLWET